MTVRKAWFRSNCSRCNEDIVVDEAIVYDPDLQLWTHEACEDDGDEEDEEEEEEEE